MLHLRTIFVVAFTSAVLAAADNPLVGTWKQNFDKTVSTSPEPFHSTILRIEPAGENRVKIIQEFVRTDGSKDQTVGLHTLDGSETHPSGSEANLTVALRPISAKVWERIAKRPGDIRHGYWAVSQDGKMLIITGFGKGADGKDYYFHRVLERQ